ncbi:MAG: bifunctional serine/threonine-protein kinase/formylglycine-generating enzyme family protein [bacterium]
MAKLGEGGMGVVYKAEDTKLKRDVAIKFLPPQIAASQDERERFKIEAQAAAALNHPRIATIHAIEEVSDELFIVMEYIEGQELRDIISHLPKGGAGGFLPIEDILNYATQIAEGLQAAHEKHVTHRDIKSANIMITDKGQVKIMDFGLAKIGGRAQITKDYSTLGTAAYMSPEQAQGKKVDPRSEYWKHRFVKDGKTLSWEEAMTYFKDKTGRPGPATWEVGDYPTGLEKYPVMGVSWYEAAAYVEFVGKSLPTVFHGNSAAGTQQSYAIVPLSNFSDGEAGHFVPRSQLVKETLDWLDKYLGEVEN